MFLFFKGLFHACVVEIDNFVQIENLIHSKFGFMLNSHQVVSFSSTGLSFSNIGSVSWAKMKLTSGVLYRMI